MPDSACMYWPAMRTGHQDNSNETPVSNQFELSEHIPECPVELFFWTAAGGDVYGQKELLEVYVAVLVGVERPEDVVAELVGVAGGEALAVDVHEGLGGQSVRTVTVQ